LNGPRGQDAPGGGHHHVLKMMARNGQGRMVRKMLSIRA
jgi:hypothetical protein